MRKTQIYLLLCPILLLAAIPLALGACEPPCPPPCPPCRGKVTGGGQGVIGTNDIPTASFGFNAMWFSDDPAPKGELDYVDHITGMHVHAHDLQYLTVYEYEAGNKPWPYRIAEFWGPCTIDGESGYTFHVYVEDRGEPGTNDIFYIELSTDYTGGSKLDPILAGNIQIHKPPP